VTDMVNKANWLPRSLKLLGGLDEEGGRKALYISTMAIILLPVSKQG
jgi:hypothetical protein